MSPLLIQAGFAEDEVCEPVRHMPNQRRRSHTFDNGQSPNIPGRLFTEINRSAPQIRLQLSIPKARGQHPSFDTSPSTQEDTPQSEFGPETPVSTSSPGIAKVVDLTKSVTTKSVYAVAHGGLSDIYTGEWHRTDAGTGEAKVVAVSTSRYIVLLMVTRHTFRSRSKYCVLWLGKITMGTVHER